MGEGMHLVINDQTETLSIYLDGVRVKHKDISGIPMDLFLQEVFKIFKKDKFEVIFQKIDRIEKDGSVAQLV